jgi:hypothetical protein
MLAAVILFIMEAKRKAFELVSETFGFITSEFDYKGVNGNSPSGLKEFKKCEDLAKKIVENNIKIFIKKIEIEDNKRGTWSDNFSELRKFWYNVIENIADL